MFYSCVLGKPTALVPGTTNQYETDTGRRVFRGPGQGAARSPVWAARAEASGGARSDAAASVATAGGTRPGPQAIRHEPPATEGVLRELPEPPRLDLLWFAWNDFLSLNA